MSVSPLHRFSLPLNISSWVTFLVSLTFYWITADPGVSYWDCPEYVTTASKMEVGHPPGNPIWMLAMRVATIPFSPQNHALVINLFSGVFMAFAAFFLCKIIFLPGRIFLQRLSNHKKLPPFSLDLIAGIISVGASLCFALCDSTWFSATEAEVYAMSAFLSSVSLWIMMEWWWERSKSRQFRLLILLAYVTGLSLGVHQLNLLLIPVYTLIILYRLNPGKLNPAYIFLWLFISLAIIGFILVVLIPGALYGAGAFELFGVNNLGLPYNSGVIFFLILISAALIIFLAISTRFFQYRVYGLNVSHFSITLWMVIFILLGFSSFGIIMIRAMAYPAMNEGVPDNIFSLRSYMAREQYPSTPLIYGNTPYSRPMLEESWVNGKPNYSRYILEKGTVNYAPVEKDAKLNYRSNLLTCEDSSANEKVIQNNHGYLIADYNFKQKLTPELDMWFPRLTSRKVSDRAAYADWTGMTEETMKKISISETIDTLLKPQPRMDIWGKRTPTYSYRPTYEQNLRYFISYQSYYMYLRYLLWNFAGRQNDYHSTGEIEHGNFISGIPVLDNAMLGNLSLYPSELWKDNKGRNRYFGIPFLIGILGIIRLLCGKRKGRRILSVVSLIFLMTGVAIVVYLNQLPGEPRERDYTFLVSYMAFSMWIAAGMLCVSSFILKRFSWKAGLVACCIFSFAPPALMAIENFDDHDRRGRFETTFYASSLMDFHIPSVIFSHGDNSTFPLWFVSEVLGMGKEHSVIDITYLNLPSYVENLKKQGNRGVNTILSTPKMAYGAYLNTRIPADSLSKPMLLADALESLYKSSGTIPEWQTSLIKIPISNSDSAVINLHEFSGGSSYLTFKHLMLLDILASQLKSETPKALFFPSLIDRSLYKPLDPYLKPALFGKIYAPWLSDSVSGSILKTSAEREFIKLDKNHSKANYVDPLIEDRSRRYRGELIIAANELLKRDDTETPQQIVSYIERYYPYSEILPGNFTTGDSTYYEGKEYSGLLKELCLKTGDKSFHDKSISIDSLMNQRYIQWIDFYKALSPNQRKTLSNRSRRMFIK